MAKVGSEKLTDAGALYKPLQGGFTPPPATLFCVIMIALSLSLADLDLVVVPSLTFPNRLVRQSSLNT